jgi:hypothetical protein
MSVGNNEVQDMLRNYFPDFAISTWTVVFGYCLAGTTLTGIFEEKHTQLILAAAITASGTRRQALSHLKGAIGLGISVSNAQGVEEMAARLNTWNGVNIARLDI